MLRTIAIASVLSAFVVFVGSAPAAKPDDPKPVKNQMVKGTIKKVDLDNSVLIVSQKVKDENVERQLDITDKTEVSVTDDKGTKTANGKDGLALLLGKTFEGANVQVKCDKDVNVLSVKVTVKGK
jgi:hypothetical protein